MPYLPTLQPATYESLLRVFNPLMISHMMGPWSSSALGLASRLGLSALSGMRYAPELARRTSTLHNFVNKMGAQIGLGRNNVQRGVLDYLQQNGLGTLAYKPSTPSLHLITDDYVIPMNPGQVRGFNFPTFNVETPQLYDNMFQRVLSTDPRTNVSAVNRWKGWLEYNTQRALYGLGFGPEDMPAAMASKLGTKPITNVVESVDRAETYGHPSSATIDGKPYNISNADYNTLHFTYGVPNASELNGGAELALGAAALQTAHSYPTHATDIPETMPGVLEAEMLEHLPGRSSIGYGILDPAEGITASSDTDRYSNNLMQRFKLLDPNSWMATHAPSAEPALPNTGNWRQRLALMSTPNYPLEITPGRAVVDFGPKRYTLDPEGGDYDPTYLESDMPTNYSEEAFDPYEAVKKPDDITKFKMRDVLGQTFADFDAQLPYLNPRVMPTQGRTYTPLGFGDWRSRLAQMQTLPNHVGILYHKGATDPGSENIIPELPEDTGAYSTDDLVNYSERDFDPDRNIYTEPRKRRGFIVGEDSEQDFLGRSARDPNELSTIQNNPQLYYTSLLQQGTLTPQTKQPKSKKKLISRKQKTTNNGSSVQYDARLKGTRLMRNKDGSYTLVENGTKSLVAPEDVELWKEVYGDLLEFVDNYSPKEPKKKGRKPSEEIRQRNEAKLQARLEKHAAREAHKAEVILAKKAKEMARMHKKANKLNQKPKVVSTPDGTHYHEMYYVDAENGEIKRKLVPIKKPNEEAMRDAAYADRYGDRLYDESFATSQRKSKYDDPGLRHFIASRYGDVDDNAFRQLADEDYYEYLQLTGLASGASSKGNTPKHGRRGRRGKNPDAEPVTK